VINLVFILVLVPVPSFLPSLVLDPIIVSYIYKLLSSLYFAKIVPEESLSKPKQDPPFKTE
jgi:hypothetical protein